MEDKITFGPGGSISFQGENAVEVFRARVIANGLRLYARTGMKPNRAYTPTAMIKAANEITGHVYCRGQYEAAAAALDEWATRQHKLINAAQEGLLQ